MRFSFTGSRVLYRGTVVICHCHSHSQLSAGPYRASCSSLWSGVQSPPEGTIPSISLQNLTAKFGIVHLHANRVSSGPETLSVFCTHGFILYSSPLRMPVACPCGFPWGFRDCQCFYKLVLLNLVKYRLFIDPQEILHTHECCLPCLRGCF